MPHGTIGKNHHCKPSANCRFPRGKIGCVVHQDYCKKHDWLCRKADESCSQCNEENLRAQKEKEEEEKKREKAKANAKDDHDHSIRKRKYDDEDDDEAPEGPKPLNKRQQQTYKKIMRMSSKAGHKPKQSKKQKEARKGDSKKETSDSGGRFYKSLLEIWEGRD